MWTQLQPATWFKWLIEGLRLENASLEGRINLTVVIIISVLAFVYAALGFINFDIILSFGPEFKAQVGIGTSSPINFIIYTSAILFSFLFSVLMLALANKLGIDFRD